MNAPALRSTALPALVTRLAGHFDMVDVNPEELIDTLKQTAFKVQGGAVVSDAQMTALLIVANQYKLNPWTKEIYAFPAKGGGIVPIVGVDGWANIINNHPQFDGMEFEYDWRDGEQSVTCVIYRKDRSKPTKVSEFLAECYRNTEPWNAMERRMLRHKAMIQCGRIAFGYGGIHDPEEGEIIATERHMGPADVVERKTGDAAGASAEKAKTAPTLPEWTDAEMKKREPKIAEFYGKGKTADEIIAFYASKATLSEAQKQRIREQQPPTNTGNAASTPGADPAQDVQPKVTYASVADRIAKATDIDQLQDAGTFIGEIADEKQRRELGALYETRHNEISAKD